MNPPKAYTLTAKQRQDYLLQPDALPDYDWEKATDEYETPPFLSKTSLRFWLNTQTIGYSTHWHNAQEIIVPLEGSYSVIIQDTLFCLQPGDILLVPPGDLHSIQAPLGGARFVFLLELDIFCQITDFFRTRSLLAKPVHITADNSPEIYEREIGLIRKAAAFYWGDNPARLLSLYSCMLEFYACYTDFCINQNASVAQSGTMPAKASLNRLTRLLEYLQKHYAEDITLEDAAQRAGLSRFYFTRLFKQHTGQTFYDYLNFLRISEAKKLLKDTDIPIRDIASACGYTSNSSFHRSFRRYQNCTPSTYRSLCSRRM